MMSLLPIVAEASKPSDHSYLIMCAAIMMAIVVIMNMRRRRPPAESTRRDRHEMDAAQSQTIAIKRSLEKLLIELEELSRKIHGQIDTKFSKLEQSIADADKRISALRILLDEAKRVADQEPPSPNTPIASNGDSTQKPDTPASEPDERHQRIYGLADQGWTPVQIAQELGTTTGEVELILNLRPSGES